MAELAPLPLDLLTPLFVLRHGRSLANEAGIIISSLHNGVLPKYALAPEGVAQAAAAGQQLRAWLATQGLAAEAVRMHASPFSRTLQTARTVAAQLGLPDDAVRVEPDLAERFFGDALECAPHSAYESVWAADAADVHSAPGGNGECVAAVAARMRSLLRRLAAERPIEPSVLLLVAHGDTLQILQAVCAEAAGGERAAGGLAQHRRFGMSTGELRHVQ